MKNTGPSPMKPLAVRHDLAVPEFKLGQKVVPGKNWERDFPYYHRQYARHLIKRQRSITKHSGRLQEWEKKEIRDCLGLFRKAKVFEVAGLVVKFGYNIDNTSFNACYLSGVAGAASPPSYGVQLVIRFRRGGNNLALIVGDTTVCPNSLQAKD